MAALYPFIARRGKDSLRATGSDGVGKACVDCEGGAGVDYDYYESAIQHSICFRHHKHVGLMRLRAFFNIREGQKEVRTWIMG